MDLQDAFDRGFETVKAYVDAELGELSMKLATLAPIPGPPGDRGENGEVGPQGEPGPQGDPNATMLPPDIAAEVARAVRALHEAPEVVERSELLAPPKVVRIERDTDGNLVPIYDGASDRDR